MKKKYMYVTLGLIMSVTGLKLVILPMALNIGGFAGISQIIFTLTGVPFSLSALLLNGVFFGWACKRHGWKNVSAAIATTLIFNLLLDMIPQVQLPQVPTYLQNTLMCTAAIIVGSGFGLIIRGGSSTGGSDYLSELITIKYPALSRGAASSVFNAFVVCATAYFFGAEFFIRSLIVTVIINESVNITLYHGNGQAVPKSLQLVFACVKWFKELANGLAHAPQTSSANVFELDPEEGQFITMRTGNRVITLKVIAVTNA